MRYKISQTELLKPKQLISSNFMCVIQHGSARQKHISKSGGNDSQDIFNFQYVVNAGPAVCSILPGEPFTSLNFSSIIELKTASRTTLPAEAVKPNKEGGEIIAPTLFVLSIFQHYLFRELQKRV